MPQTKGSYKQKPGHRTVGSWSWNDNRLWDKIEVSLDPDECWAWHGSMSPSGALMGGWKNEVQQMTQARRLVYMSQTNEDVSKYRVTMKCANQACCNPHHFIIKPTNRPEKTEW